MHFLTLLRTFPEVPSLSLVVGQGLRITQGGNSRRRFGRRRPLGDRHRCEVGGPSPPRNLSLRCAGVAWCVVLRRAQRRDTKQKDILSCGPPLGSALWGLGAGRAAYQELREVIRMSGWLAAMLGVMPGSPWCVCGSRTGSHVYQFCR